MGQKRTWKGIDILFCLAGCLIGLSGCFHTPEIWKTEEHLARAKYHLDKGQYDNALKESRTALEIYPQLLGDKAYFMIGLIYVHPDNPKRDGRKAREAFEKVVRHYPESALKIQAEIWEKILLEDQQMQTVLQAHNREIRNLKKAFKDQQAQLEQLSAKHTREMAEKDKLIQELRKNIDQLKEIDLKIEEKKRKPVP
jgi:tetratricopeptide (TPR) repeat protein